MCHQWTGIFFFNLVSGPALIIEPTGSIHDLNHSTSVEKKASTSQDINEGMRRISKWPAMSLCNLVVSVYGPDVEKLWFTYSSCIMKQAMADVIRIRLKFIGSLVHLYKEVECGQ